jgi:hypothetical protein
MSELGPSVPKLSEPGPWIGHYTSATIAFEHIVPTGELRMSPYRLMRDPAENKDLLPATAFFTKEGVDQEKAYWEALGLIKQERDRMRLLSTTRDVTHYPQPNEMFGCCWARPRVWEQYADAHRGVCLVFDRVWFTNALTKSFGENIEFGEVDYTPLGIADSEANSTLVDERLSDEATRQQAVLDYLTHSRRDLFFLKSDDWTTEYEFRALLTSKEDEYAFADYGDSLRAVVLGEQFPKWQIAGAKEVCEAANVQLRQIVWWKGRPITVSAKTTD